MSWTSRSPDETRRIARALGASLLPVGGGIVISLVGELGAGKTVFAKGLAEGLGIDAAAVSSPTFVLAQELPTAAGMRLVHADFYRIESAAELEMAGLDDWLAADALLLVEWGERFAGSLPADRMQVRIERAQGGDRSGGGVDPDERRIQATAGGVDSSSWLEGWQESWRKPCP
jgi:tRNA threonylcarbamoyladenosine biosynthesis protein TsaE